MLLQRLEKIWEKRRMEQVMRLTQCTDKYTLFSDASNSDVRKDLHVGVRGLFQPK